MNNKTYLFSKFSLKGKVSIVVGGYGFLGKLIAKSLANAGSTVYVAGKNIDKFNKFFKRNQKINIHFLEFDVRLPKSVKNGFKTIYIRHKKIDILINCAVFLEREYPEKITFAEWSRGLNGVLNHVFLCNKEIIPYMKKSFSGNIINIASIYGVISPDFNMYKNRKHLFCPPYYAVGKAGIIHLTKYFAKYFSTYNIRVNCISPGVFPSSIIQKDKSFISKIKNKIPLGRIGKPEDLEGLVVFLASDSSSYITGQNIIIDGGFTLS